MILEQYGPKKSKAVHFVTDYRSKNNQYILDVCCLSQAYFLKILEA